MPKAIQLSAYGAPKSGEVVVRVVASGTNPGEIMIREGHLRERFPMEFPFGQGSDFAGRIDSVGPDVTGFAPDDEVLGWSDQRSAHADHGVAPGRINTIIDFAGAQMFGTQAKGSAAAASRETLAAVADHIAWGDILMPLTAIYPFATVHDAAITEPIRPPQPTG